MWTSGPAEGLLSFFMYIVKRMLSGRGNLSGHSARGRFVLHVCLEIMARAFPKTIHKNNERVALASRKEKKTEDLRTADVHYQPTPTGHPHRKAAIQEKIKRP